MSSYFDSFYDWFFTDEQTSTTELELSPLPDIKLIGRQPNCRSILTSQMAEELRPKLPTSYEICTEWHLLYSLDQHGASLNTMYHQFKPYLDQNHAYILILQTTLEDICGIFFNVPLHIQHNYYGNGQTFLFKFPLHCYSSTNSNNYYILSHQHMLAFGGNGFALSFNDQFSNGMTAPSTTFHNPAYLLFI